MHRFAVFLAILARAVSCQAQGQPLLQPTAVQAGAGPAFAQGTPPAGPEARYYRVICLVHMTGSGKHTDPSRPEVIPSGGSAALTRDGILGWSMQLTDDKRMAIVHLVASNKRAFDALLDHRRPDIRVFEIGRHGKDTIETEIRKYKKDFSLEKFQVLAQ